jgi:ATP-dependent Clp protease protease subunit
MLLRRGHRQRVIVAELVKHEFKLRSVLVGSGQNKYGPRFRPANDRPSTGRLISPTQERRVVLRSKITKVVASCCIARMVVLAAEDQEQPIIIHIDSPGGSAAEAIGILSTMNGIRCPVLTFCRGQAIGPAAVIAAHGQPGHRSAVPGVRFSLRLSGFSDQTQGNFDGLMSLLAETLAKDTRRPMDEVIQWFTTGLDLGPQEAIKRGLLDTITNSAPSTHSARPTG